MLLRGMGSAPLQLTGKERDAETGNGYFGARYYSSSSGRFLSPDWAARPTAVPYAVFGDPQSLNLYGYVRDDPVSRADADGHCARGRGTCSLSAEAHRLAALANSTMKKLQRKGGKAIKNLKLFAKAHPKATKVIVTTVIVVTAISGAADEGASEAAIPEEEAAGAALESGTEAGEAGQVGEGAGSKAADDLKSIEKAQQRVRSGSDRGRRIIDSIEKSAQRLKSMLRKRYDPTDWE